MSPAPQRVVVDTNVWLDYYLPNRPGYEIARRALLAAFTRKISLLYAVTTAKDVFFLSSMILKRDGRRDGRVLTQGDALAIAELSWGFVNNLSEMAAAVGADYADVWLALKYKHVHRDFEDNFVIAAAQRAGADLILTTDEALMSHAPVACMRPEDFLALLETLEPQEA